MMIGNREHEDGENRKLNRKWNNNRQQDEKTKSTRNREHEDGENRKLNRKRLHRDRIWGRKRKLDRNVLHKDGEKKH